MDYSSVATIWPFVFNQLESIVEKLHLNLNFCLLEQLSVFLHKPLTLLYQQIFGMQFSLRGKIRGL